ncbi:MAG: hypothetical protein IJA23_02110, partial [Clostridia bacterium]|nr:hypothetical protein [Clostridia bacterium]
YAIFEPKPYEVKVANDVNFGFGSLENKSADEDIVSPHKDKSISYKYQITGSDETKTMSTASKTVFEASNEILFEITINNGTDGDFYIFDRIEILNVGYYTGSDYKYANVILTYNNAWNLWVQKNNNQLARPANGIYMSGNTQGLYDNINGTVAMHTYSSGTYKDYSFVDSSQVGINGFKIDTGSNATVLYLRVKNVGYAGNEKDQNDSSSRGCFDYKINNDSVTGRGQYGFTIKSFVKSNYKSADDVVTNWDYGSTDVNDAANESFVSNNDGEGNALLTTPNYLTMSHIIPIKTANLVYQSNGAVGSVYYVWINGTKYTLRNSANNGFMTTEDSVDDLKGYYELKSDRYLRYSNDDSKQVFFYEKLTGGATQHYISYYAVKCTGNVTLSNAKYIYFDCSSSSKNVYYLGAYKLNVTTNSYHNVNYNNTQFLAIAPQQTKIKFSTKPNAAAYSDDLKIRYELDYYLSAIKFGSAEYTLHAGDLLKHYHTDGKYDKFETLNSDLEAIESVANEYITYLGEKYETKYAYKILVGTRTYILYFTIRVDSSGNYKDNYVMYFLMSTVGNIENKAITLTYKKLQYNISVNVTDFEGANGFNAQPNNATVNYYD